MKKIVVLLLVFAAVLISFPFVFYLEITPWAVSNQDVLNYAKSYVDESLKVDLEIKNPVLKTQMKPEIEFSLGELNLSKDNIKILSVKNFDTVIDFSKVFEKQILVKKFGADYLFADVNKLMTLAPAQKGQPQKTDWNVDLFNTLLYVKNCLVLYQAAPDLFIKVDGKDIKITETKNPKFVEFKINADVKKGKETIKIALSDNKSVFIKDRKLFIKNAPITINNSKILMSSVSDEKNNFDVTFFSKKFDVKNVIELIDTNLVIPNGHEMLAFFKDVNGSFDFDFNLKNSGMNGVVILNKANLKLVPMANMPVTMHKGKVVITSKEILLSGFEGFYGKQAKNKFKFDGKVTDYFKSVNTEILATGKATKELTTDYLSKVVGYPLELTGDSGMKMVIKSVYNKIDINWGFKLAKGDDILVGGASLSPVNWDRALSANLHLDGNKLNIESINYYIAQVINKQSKIKPILTINGNMDAFKGTFFDLGFNIPKPLPSEFLNVLIGQKLFKKGMIAGHMQVDNNGKYPVLNGELSMDGVRIPSQRLSIREGTLKTDKNLVHLDARGRFRRSDYKFTGSIVNEIKAPVIVKDINLTVADVDVERLMKSFNNQNTEAVKADSIANVEKTAPTLVSAEAEEADEEAYTFDTGILIVEKCVLNVVKGAYKDIKFGNLFATLTLDKEGILKVDSNRFDIAEGISSLKVNCDLKKHLYDLKLGVKDINSDLMATTLLALKKEITGKASGGIHLYTDDSMKLNGRLVFVVKDGTIQKVGLVEYALKFAALFRNPMAMISPSTIVDLVNVPEGKFNKISGDLTIKDNVIEKIKIKSSSPQLSSYIAGRMDLEKRDSTLRIYTKFSSKNKGFSGFMRNISLNSLANRVPLNARNDSNYYSSELSELPDIEAEERDCQVFLTKVDGDVERFNFLSSLRKIK